jgi:hypothetical protein
MLILGVFILTKVIKEKDMEKAPLKQRFGF